MATSTQTIQTPKISLKSIYEIHIIQPTDIPTHSLMLFTYSLMFGNISRPQYEKSNYLLISVGSHKLPTEWIHEWQNKKEMILN